MNKKIIVLVLIIVVVLMFLGINFIMNYHVQTSNSSIPVGLNNSSNYSVTVNITNVSISPNITVVQNFTHTFNITNETANLEENNKFANEKCKLRQIPTYLSNNCTLHDRSCKVIEGPSVNCTSGAYIVNSNSVYHYDCYCPGNITVRYTYDELNG